jgi:hypothetical protein
MEYMQGIRRQYLANELRGIPVVTYLLINHINDMPEISINSCLKFSSAPIVIGYLNESDLLGVPNDPRIYFLKLNDSIESGGSRNYTDFESLDFFMLVTYKWILFKRLFEDGIDHLIYSDLDVIWYADVADIMAQAHRNLKEVKLFIQSITALPGKPSLCMGIVSMTKSREIENLIQNCHQRHVGEVHRGHRYGDDDAITEFNEAMNYPVWIRELPQSTFPVGMFINNYSKSSLFPGLFATKPFLFHANYVIGERNKIALMRLANRLIASDKNEWVRWSVFLYLKKVRLFFGILRNRFFR